jgi:anti-sigma B factor antagonist
MKGEADLVLPEGRDMFHLFAPRPDRDDSAPATPDVNPSVPSPRTFEDAIADVEVMGETVVATLTVTELAGDTGATRLADLLYELGQMGVRHYVLDIQNVQFMDSACLGCLVEALNLMSANGGDGKIALANADHAVQSLFRLTRLDRLFPIAQDVMSALVAVEGKPEE